ncbi:Bpifb9 [Vulpes lagopus]|uniref:vomeromodulin-like n=1 Tax=Vulpes lagopus TaxID=494514 RepID=UPI001BC9D137|nr:vomeromodulin-like [Vulpes lagopus]
MLTLWALVITLTIQARAIDLPSPSLLVGTLPINEATGAVKNVPLALTGRQLRNTQKGSPSIKRQVGTPGVKCSPVAKYLLSRNYLEEYLNATLPPKIKKKLMCEEVLLSGMIGKVISTVSSSDLLSVLDITSALNIPGGVPLGGILGKESGGQSPKLPLPLLSKATDALGTQKDLGSLPPTGAEKNPVKGLINNLGLANLPLPLNDVGDQASKLTESTQDMLNSVVPAGVEDAVTGLLGNLNLEDLLLGLEVQKVTVESMTTTMTGDGILVHATTTAFIGGKGLAGPVVSILGYEVHGDVTLKIGISTNNTQCVNLQVQDKDIKVKKVTLQITDMLTDTLPLPVPLPLDNIISQVLTVAMKENFQESESCNIDFSDFNECKNSTGLFKYDVKSSRISTRGLFISYCAKALFNNNIVPVPGSPLPPDPKNANISLTLSHMLLKVIITLSAKQSSAKMNNLTASITKIAYFFQSGNKIQATYWVTVEKDGESVANGKTTLIISHNCKISKDKLILSIKIESSEHSVTPPEAEDEVQDIMHLLLKKFLSAFNEMTSTWNVPPEITSNPLTNAKVQVLKSNDLQAAN